MESIKAKLTKLKNFRLKEYVKEKALAQIEKGVEHLYGKAIYAEELPTEKYNEYKYMLDTDEYFQLHKDSWRNDLTQIEQKDAEKVFYFQKINKILLIITNRLSVIFSLSDKDTKENAIEKIVGMTKAVKAKNLKDLNLDFQEVILIRTA